MLRRLRALQSDTPLVPPLRSGRRIAFPPGDTAARPPALGMPARNSVTGHCSRASLELFQVPPRQGQKPEEYCVNLLWSWSVATGGSGGAEPPRQGQRQEEYCVHVL